MCANMQQENIIMQLKAKKEDKQYKLRGTLDVGALCR